METTARAHLRGARAGLGSQQVETPSAAAASDPMTVGNETHASSCACAKPSALDGRNPLDQGLRVTGGREAVDEIASEARHVGQGTRFAG